MLDSVTGLGGSGVILGKENSKTLNVVIAIKAKF